MTGNDWMSNEKLKDIEPHKLEFIQNLVFEFAELDDKKRLPFLLALATRAKKENITFSNEEIELIISVIKETSSEKEVNKINQMLKIFASRNKT